MTCSDPRQRGFALLIVLWTLALLALLGTQLLTTGRQDTQLARNLLDAATLEVRDKDKVATFSGDVHVTQGDTNMRCKSLVVFYEQDEASADKSKTLKAASPGPGGQQRIKRLEARGGVVVTQKEQTATGETGIFDMKSNTVTLNGKVVMTQGQNVLRGDRLVVNLTSGVSRVESGNGGGRVQGLFQPGGGALDIKQGMQGGSAPAPAPAPARPPN